MNNGLMHKLRNVLKKLLYLEPSLKNALQFSLLLK